MQATTGSTRWDVTVIWKNATRKMVTVRAASADEAVLKAKRMQVITSTRLNPIAKCLAVRT